MDEESLGVWCRESKACDNNRSADVQDYLESLALVVFDETLRFLEEAAMRSVLRGIRVRAVRANPEGIQIIIIMKY